MSTREGADDYHTIIAILNNRWRVIDSCQPYPYRQWILQQRVRNNPNAGWEGRSFSQTRIELIKEVKRRLGTEDVNKEALLALVQLPDKI
jgi:hypothetical protein